MSLQQSPVFFLGCNFTDVIGTGFTSHYFNITIPPTTPNSTSSSLQPSATATQTPTNSPSQSDVVKVGVGVGVSLGVCLLALIGYVIWLKMAKKNRVVNQSPETATNPHHSDVQSYYKYEPGLHQPAVYEAIGHDQMPGSTVYPLELDTANVQR
jgi:hypothetical protein